MAEAYESVNADKAARLRDCAIRLSFIETKAADLAPEVLAMLQKRKKKEIKMLRKLAGAWFCKVRLCPMCSWRRSLKVAAQMRKIMDAIQAEQPKAYILLTLTMRNCSPDELDAEITRYLKAFNLMTKHKDFKAAVCGYYRTMEITHNLADGTFHPHIHAILAVDKSYFSSCNYLSQKKWTSLWKRAAGLNYDPSVDVRRVKGNTAKAVAETAKYAVKSSDYIIPNDWDLTVATVKLLDKVLHNRRFIAFGGIFKDYHKKLNLDDAEDGDLIHVDPDEKPPEPEAENVVHYLWYSGYRQYFRDISDPL